MLSVRSQSTSVCILQCPGASAWLSPKEPLVLCSLAWPEAGSGHGTLESVTHFLLSWGLLPKHFLMDWFIQGCEGLLPCCALLLVMVRSKRCDVKLVNWQWCKHIIGQRERERLEGRLWALPNVCISSSVLEEMGEAVGYF